MNFFLPSGNLDLAEARGETAKVEVTETKSIHSSDDDLDQKNVPTKLASLPRRQKTKGLMTRKINKEFRSVWYDEDVEVIPETKPSGLKKATSLDNLLDIGVSRLKSRNAISKKMISSPICARKIEGEWVTETEKKKLDDITISVRRKLSETIEAASIATEYFQKISEENTSAGEGNSGDSEWKITDDKVGEIKEESDVLSEGKIETKLTESVDSTGDVTEPISVKGENQDNLEEENIDKKTQDIVEPTLFSLEVQIEPELVPDTLEVLPEEKPNIEQEKSLSETSVVAVQTETNAEQENTETYNVIQPILLQLNLQAIEYEAPESKTDLQIDTKNSVDVPETELLRKSSFSTSKNVPVDSEVVELRNLGPTSYSTLPPPSKVAETKLLGPRDAYYKKHGTLEGRGRLKRGGKIEISGPIAPRIQMENKEVDLTGLDAESVTNLLRQKSRSTNDLLKSFNQIKNEKSEQLNNPKFPISESEETDDEVQVRRHHNINQYRCSKTTDFDFGRKWTDNSKDFEVRGLTKMFISSDTSPVKLRRSDILKYQNGHFYKIDESSKKVLKANVTLKTARLLNRKDVELRDSNNISYILFFDSSKDAKLFIENDRVRCYTENDNKSTITKTLLRLLGKRSSREVLEKKGIYQNEPIFGNTLRNIYNTEKGVPRFILRTMELIERPENITNLGIYRTSGNLATIQKIRFEVDKGRLGILNEYCKDVDVLTGCLKLFFRELKEPLIPCDICDSLLTVTKADKNYSKSDRGQIRQILSKLPEANSETLYVLIKHLIEVVKYKEENKMDTYNLSVCWGPTIIFMSDPTPLALSKDPMAQTADAARAFDALLTYYIDNPEELNFSKKSQEHLDSNRNPIQRQDSRESIRSFDSNKSQKKSGSNPNLNVDEVLKKSVELIELNINSEGLYKKCGSTEKINKIVKKMMKKKVGELERHKFDVNDLTDSLKKYLREIQEPLVTQECVEQVNKFCDIAPCLETNNRQRIVSVVESLPKKDTVVFLLKHIVKVMRHESQHNVSKTDILNIWSNVLNTPNKTGVSNEKFCRFLKAVLDVFDDTKGDLVPSPKSLSNGLLNDLKNYQKDKDRVSKYDNVPDAEGNVLKEATILEEKTEEAEYTKL